MSFDIKNYLRTQYLPHIWCPGCGHGIALQGVLRGIDKLNLDKDKVVIVSGIGCSSRSVGYVDFNTVHTAHGRALPFATGIKMAKPELTVLIIAGDGDLTAIGGNHFIHTARRNIDLTVIIFNNSNYGMTGGQYSSLTPNGAITSTSRYGNMEREFDICSLAKGSGATYIARTTSYHVAQIPNLVTKSINNKGFSVVEIISQCPTYYGKNNKTPSAVEMLEWQRDNSIPVSKTTAMSDEDLKGKPITGEFFNNPEGEYTEQYANIIT